MTVFCSQPRRTNPQNTLWAANLRQTQAQAQPASRVLCQLGAQRYPSFGLIFFRSFRRFLYLTDAFQRSQLQNVHATLPAKAKSTPCVLSPRSVALLCRPLNVTLQEPSPEVIACINNGEDQEQESAQEDERQTGLDGQWQESGSGDLSQLDHFMASEWGMD